MVKSCDRSLASGINRVSESGAALTDKALGCEKLLFREQVLEASKLIVDSSSSGPGNEAGH